MRPKDLGFNEADCHDGCYTYSETALVQALIDLGACGTGAKVSANMLCWKWAFPKAAHMPHHMRMENEKRDLREMVNHLVIEHNEAILSRAGKYGGYWLAINEAEAESFYWTFRKRAMTGLLKAARGKRAALAEMVTQLSFNFDLPESSGPVPGGRAQTRTAPADWPTAAEVVTQTLERMTREPERYAAALQDIGEKFRGVFLSREKVQRLRQGFNQILKELEGVEV